MRPAHVSAMALGMGCSCCAHLRRTAREGAGTAEIRVPETVHRVLLSVMDRPRELGRNMQAQGATKRSSRKQDFLYRRAIPSFRKAMRGGNERSGSSMKGTCPRPGSNS